MKKKLLILVLLLLIIGSFGLVSQHLVFFFQHQVLTERNKPLSPFVGQEQKQSLQKLLKIALLADSHNSWENLKQAIEQVNQEDFDLVIFLGDLTSLGSLEDFKKGKEILDNLKVPYYIIPGNHDIWWSRRDAKAHNEYLNQVFANNFLPCFEKEGFNFILIDNANEQKGVAEPDWQNLETCLSKNLKAFVFLHEPVFHPASERLMGKYEVSVATQAAKLRQTFCDQKIQLIVASHLHSFAKYFYDCPNGYQLPMIVSGALTNERNFQSPRFLELVIFEDGKFEEKEILLKD